MENWDWLPFIGTMIVALISVNENRKTWNSQKKEGLKKQKTNKKKRLEIKLEEFYIPLRHLLENSKTLYFVFKKNKPRDFRTLTYLLDPEQVYGNSKKKVVLTKNDRVLLNEIIAIGEKIQNLIYNKAFLAGDDPSLSENYRPGESFVDEAYEKDMTILSLLLSHIIVMRLAFQGELFGESEKFTSYVFPNEINSIVDAQIGRIVNIVKQLEDEVEALDQPKGPRFLKWKKKQKRST